MVSSLQASYSALYTHEDQEKEDRDLKSFINADCFIPRHKKLQWDLVPGEMMIVSPSRHTTDIDALSQWIYLPLKRRSNFDTCTFNLMHHFPDALTHFQKGFFSRSSLYFGPDLLSNRYRANMHKTYSIIQGNRRVIMEVKQKLDSFAGSKFLRDEDLSLAIIKTQCRNGGSPYSESRIMGSTPERVARLSDEIESLVQKGGVSLLNEEFQLGKALGLVCKDYLTKLHMVMDVEQMQAFEDMKSYDLYSRKFECIEIPPPVEPNPHCPGCTRQYNMAMKNACAYHCNLELHPTFRDLSSFPILESKVGRNKPSIISSPHQFRNLNQTMKKLKRETEARLIGYLKVPGIAENRPLVSIGDLIRLRFDQTEVIGEVGEVEVKTEKVMIFLPACFKKGPISGAYFQALNYPKNKYDENKYNSNRGRFDVRFGTFSSRAYDVFKTTLQSSISRNRMDQITRVIAPTPFLRDIKKKAARGQQIEISQWVYDLNHEQKNAVHDIVNGNHSSAPYIIYGPPGTGKTMTVVESICQILQHDTSNRILVCAPSDAACDVIAKRFLSVIPKFATHSSKRGRPVKMMRVNWWSRNPASLPPVLISSTPSDEFGFFRLPTKDEIESADVIICQCFVSGLLDIGAIKPLMENHFTHTIIDESCQSFEFEVLIPLLKVGKDCSIVLAGDPKQLGPTVRSPTAALSGMALSLQERLMGLPLYQMSSEWCVITKLLDNYRSHDALLRVPSELFYEGNLRHKASTKVTATCENFELLNDGKRFPMMLYDVTSGKEMSKLDTPSFYNVEECHAVLRIINALISSPNVEIHTGQIAVITCFRAQVLKMRSILRDGGLASVNVGVVEDFQGQEMQVVLISTVLTTNQEKWRTGPRGGLGFMTDPKRFNVAITRASALCIIVGKSEFLESSGSYWTALIEHIRRNNGMNGDFEQEHHRDSTEDDIYDYGISEFIRRIEDLNLLGMGHEMDRYDYAMRGYYQDAPEWKVCL